MKKENGCHGGPVHLPRLSKPRHHRTSGASVVRDEIVHAGRAAARKIQQVVVIAAADVDEQKHAIRPLSNAAHAVEAGTGAATAQRNHRAFHLPISRCYALADVAVKQPLHVADHAAARASRSGSRRTRRFALECSGSHAIETRRRMIRRVVFVAGDSSACKCSA